MVVGNNTLSGRGLLMVSTTSVWRPLLSLFFNEPLCKPFVPYTTRTLLLSLPFSYVSSFVREMNCMFRSQLRLPTASIFQNPDFFKVGWNWKSRMEPRYCKSYPFPEIITREITGNRHVSRRLFFSIRFNVIVPSVINLAYCHLLQFLHDSFDFIFLANPPWAECGSDHCPESRLLSVCLITIYMFTYLHNYTKYVRI